MTSDEFKSRFPNASAATIAANCGPRPQPSGESVFPSVQRAVKLREIADLHEPFRKWLRSQRDVFVIYSRADQPTTTRAGLPDFILLVPRGRMAVEMKCPGKNLRAEQEKVRAELLAIGVPYLVAYSAQDAIEFVKSQLSI